MRPPQYDIPDHPLRQRLAHEVHTRPFAVITTPSQISVLAFHIEEGRAAGERAHFAKLCAHYNRPPPPEGEKYYTDHFGAFRVKWERHTEFGVYVFIREAPFDEPFEDPVLNLLPADWLAHVPGHMLVGLHLAIERPGRNEDGIARLFDYNNMVSSRVTGGKARVWTDFRLHGDGFGRIYVHDSGMTDNQAGRLIQRLREIETYRMTALMAFPVAQELVADLKQVDARLSDIANRMAESGSDPDRDAALLGELTDLAAHTERLSAGRAYRFGAARAYHGLVNERLTEIREERMEGFQTMTGFMNRRLSPAMLTCMSVADRLDHLSTRIGRANNLLRTRVNLQLEKQNAALLDSMNKRARLQLRLQETVEGLSLAAMTYYIVGLVNYGLKAVRAAGAQIDAALFTGLSVPLVLSGLFLGLKWVKKKMRKQMRHLE